MAKVLEAVAQPVLRCWKGTVLTVPNRCLSKLRLQPLRANDGPQGLKPLSFRPGFGTTEVVPLRRSEEVMQQLLTPKTCARGRRGSDGRPSFWSAPCSRCGSVV